MKLWLFIKLKNIEVVSPGVFHYFHPKNLCQDHSGHHDIHLHMWKHDIGHKNHQTWSTEAEILVIFQTKVYKKFSPGVFCGFFTILTLTFYAWTILAIMISIFTHESMILAKK